MSHFLQIAVEWYYAVFPFSDCYCAFKNLLYNKIELYLIMTTHFAIILLKQLEPVTFVGVDLSCDHSTLWISVFASLFWGNISLTVYFWTILNQLRICKWQIEKLCIQFAKIQQNGEISKPFFHACFEHKMEVIENIVWTERIFFRILRLFINILNLSK